MQGFSGTDEKLRLTGGGGAGKMGATFLEPLPKNPIRKMTKKAMLLIVAWMCLLFAAKADQLAFVPEKDARAAVELLQTQPYVLLHCGCCDDDTLQYVKIRSVSCHPAGYKQYFQVFVEGVDANGNPVFEGIDLAYAYIRKGKTALCVGKALHLDCDPCLDGPLAWTGMPF